MTYSKPDFYVTEFAADRAFASTSCTKDFSSSITTYPAQTVTCIIDGSETIFTSGTAGCTTVISENYSYFTTYDGTNYFVWYDGNVNSSGKDSVEGWDTLIKAILGTLGIDDSGWHAATYSFTVTDYYTNSY